MTTDWWQQPAATPDENARARALHRQTQLTKPAGSLGRLEQLAVSLCALQAADQPRASQVSITLFAGDHGVTDEGISAFPASVTVEMLRNFATGGAAISVLARALGAVLRVVDVGSHAAPGSIPGIIERRVAAGTCNFRHSPAMTDSQLRLALQAGRDEVTQAMTTGLDILCAGEMGIGNTTAASAMLAVLLDVSPETVTGPGTGLTQEGVSHKARVIRDAIALHASAMSSPWECLRHLGGFEIAALCGFYIAAAQQRCPVVVDGFICTAAAITALKLNPSIAPWLIFSHASAEPGFAAIASHLPEAPLLDLGLRLGEGSGAASCIPLLRLACALHNEMATFAAAGVSDAHSGPSAHD